MTSIKVMNVRNAPTSRGVPRVLRIVLCLGLVFGIFAMHEIFTGESATAVGHHMAVSDASAPHVTDTLSAVAQRGDDTAPELGGNDLSGCCGIVVLCMAMLGGLGALLILRSRGHHRVLWELPRPIRTGRSLRVPQFSSLTPLQRSSVLRC